MKQWNFYAVGINILSIDVIICYFKSLKEVSGLAHLPFCFLMHEQLEEENNGRCKKQRHASGIEIWRNALSGRSAYLRPAYPGIEVSEAEWREDRRGTARLGIHIYEISSRRSAEKIPGTCGCPL